MLETLTALREGPDALHVFGVLQRAAVSMEGYWGLTSFEISHRTKGSVAATRRRGLRCVTVHFCLM